MVFGVIRKCLIALFFVNGLSQAGVLTVPVGDSLWVANDETTQVAISSVPAGNSILNPTPSWGVVQWNGPAPLGYPYTQTLYQNGNWQLANSSASIQYDKTTAPWLGGVYTLAQNGAGLQCNPSPLMEYDLFLAPKSLGATFGENARLATNGLAASLPLHMLQSLSFNLGVGIQYEQIGSNCGVNQAGYLVGFQFRNTSTGTAFFYQIYFRVATRIGQSQSVQLGVPNKATFVDTHGNVGVDDHVSYVSSGLQSPFPGGGRIAYSLNILPRLTSIIQAGGGNMFDSNLSHYQLMGVYFGQNVWGNTQGTASWDNFSIVTAP